ncbi:hypothetical protein JCM10207_007942 [Rhodosporidiobolus poonsookiae]
MTSAPPPADIGTHCAVPACNALDFLPLVCPHCSSAFCSPHAPPSAHACAADPSLRILTAATRSASGPELRELLAKRYKREEATLTPEEVAWKEKQQAAMDKLRASMSKSKAATGAKGGASTSTGAATAKKVSPAIELMKLKQRAKPADPKHVKREGDVPMAERVFLTVRFEEEVREVWVSKAVTAGKALDLCANLFGLNNQNASTRDPAKLLSLAMPAANSDSDPPTRLALPELLSKQVPNGGKVLLLKGYAW